MANEAEILEIADAAVTALNGQAFAAPYQRLNAARVYVPLFDLKGLTTLQVPVVPHSLAGKIISRVPTREMGYEIDVGFLLRVPGPLPMAPATLATLDGLMGLVESVGDFLINTAGALGLASGKQATPLGVVNDPVWDPKKLDEEQVFLSVLTVTYRTFR